MGLSQDSLAKSLGISRPTYIKLEKGIAKPSESQRLILSSILGLSKNKIEENNLSDKPDTRMNLIRVTPTEDFVKFKETLLYILGKIGSKPNIGQTVLYKILYFIDFDYYEKFEKQIIGARYIKNTFGPTPISFAKIIKEMEKDGKIVEVKSKYFDRDQTKYIPVIEADMSMFSGQELQHIDFEIERLGHFSATQLSELSHKDTPWSIANDKEVLDYEFVFYRSRDTSIRVYEQV